MRALFIAIVVCWTIILQAGLSLGAEPAGRNRDDGRVRSVFPWYSPEWKINKVLADLAKAQGLDPEDYRRFRMPYGGVWGFTEDAFWWGDSPDPSYIRTVYLGHEREDTYAVAVQTVAVVCAPGVSGQQIVLLTLDGKILDRVQCYITSGYGEVKTEVFPGPDLDGARIVINFFGMPRNPGEQRSKWIRYSCPCESRIIFHDKWWAFQMNTKDAKDVNSPWHIQGLCRIAIADHKFKVLFPKLEMTDLSKTTSLRVTYWVGGERRQIILDHPKEVSRLVSMIKVKGRKQRYPEPEEPEHFINPSLNRRGAWVEFFIGAGDLRKMAFTSDRKLVDARGGELHLGNDAFFKALSDAASKTEGKRVNLLETVSWSRDFIQPTRWRVIPRRIVGHLARNETFSDRLVSSGVENEIVL